MANRPKINGIEYIMVYLARLYNMVCKFYSLCAHMLVIDPTRWVLSTINYT